MCNKNLSDTSFGGGQKLKWPTEVWEYFSRNLHIIFSLQDRARLQSVKIVRGTIFLPIAFVGNCIINWLSSDHFCVSMCMIGAYKALKIF